MKFIQIGYLVIRIVLCFRIGETTSYLLTERKGNAQGDNETIRAVVIDRVRMESSIDRICDQE